jgi:hypothetical protein
MATAQPNLNGRLREVLARGGGETGPYVLRSILPADGWWQRRRSTMKLKRLRKLDGAIRPMLQDGERVVFLSWGSFSTWLGMFFGGAVHQLINHRAMVLTDRRVLLIQVSAWGRPMFVRAQIEYGTVSRVKNTLFGTLRIRFREGGSETVFGVPRADRKALAAALTRTTELTPAAPDEGVQDLCPHCHERVREDAPRCPGCLGTFKSPRNAALLSLVFPGMGDLYLGYRLFSAMEIVGALSLWLVTLALALDPATPPTVVFVLAGMLAAAHGLDAVSTRHVAYGGLYPAPRQERVGLRYAVAALVPVGVIAASVGPLIARQGLTPAPGVVAGAELSPRHVAALRKAGYLTPDETVVRFFSPGGGSILQGGSIQTNARLASYAQDADISYFAALPFDSIADLSVEPWPDAPAFGALRVIGNDGQWFIMLAPTAGGQDAVFFESVANSWRAGRAAAPGFWFDGGGGSTPDDAVVVQGVTSPDEISPAEDWWLELWLGEPETDWRLRSRTRRRDGFRQLDEIVVLDPDGVAHSFYFDVSSAVVIGMR